MSMHTLTLQPGDRVLSAATGSRLSDVLRAGGVDLTQPCGGQGRCGRCVVQVTDGQVRRRSTLRLTAADLEAGYALACQAIVEGDATVVVPEQEAIERRLTTDKVAHAVALPLVFDRLNDQSVRVVPLALDPPTLTDSIDDVARVQRSLTGAGLGPVEVPLALLQTLGPLLREADWSVAAIVELDTWQRPAGPARLIGLIPQSAISNQQSAILNGVAIDIGTTTVTVYLVDLETGAVRDVASEYNGQIFCGEDVISRIIYASKGDGLAELRSRVLGTINTLLARLAQRNHLSPAHIVKATVAGNPTMAHLFLGLAPASIRLTPFIPTINHPAPITATEAGLDIHPLAGVDVLPGVAAYVGADITAGALAAGLPEAEALTLFIDVGTNGEIVLGDRDWLITCACSAGPAFEGAGVLHGMRATRGAIEEVWINAETFEPSYRVIGEVPPRGLCGSGLIALLAELLITGVMDRGGGFKQDVGTPRVRAGEHGLEYVVAWAAETAIGRDIVLTKVDVDNLMRAKAAIYAGFTVLAQSVGVELESVERFLIGGAFGQYINVEKAVQIGLLPDLPWERFHFLGNTAVKGAALALLSRAARASIHDLAAKMTYLELSADNSFYDAFTNALFLPHTDLSGFPSVARLLSKG